MFICTNHSTTCGANRIATRTPAQIIRIRTTAAVPFAFLCTASVPQPPMSKILALVRASKAADSVQRNWRQEFPLNPQDLNKPWEQYVRDVCEGYGIPLQLSDLKLIHYSLFLGDEGTRFKGEKTAFVDGKLDCLLTIGAAERHLRWNRLHSTVGVELGLGKSETLQQTADKFPALTVFGQLVLLIEVLQVGLEVLQDILQP